MSPEYVKNGGIDASIVVSTPLAWRLYLYS